MHFSLWEKLGFALLTATWVAFGANYVGNTIIHTEPLAESAYKVEVEAAEQAPTAEVASAEESAPVSYTHLRAQVINSLAL